MDPLLPSIHNIDLKLLRVFQSVVRHNGFSAAQDHLGLNQSTISNHIISLEERLGVRLCERGRKGFRLTEQGRLVHTAMLDLFGSMENFRSAVGSARKELIGSLVVGMVDAMYTNTEFPLSEAVAEFCASAPGVYLDIDIASPQDLNQGLLNGRYHIILTPMGELPKSICTIDLMGERQLLCCGKNHSLFSTDDNAITRAMLTKYPFAGRSYMKSHAICGIDFDWKSVTAHMEGTALLIDSGQFIAFLPDHFAERWVRRGQMRAIQPEIIKFDDIFRLACKRREPNLVVTRFVECTRKLAQS